jgi:hypothetical protein
MKRTLILTLTLTFTLSSTALAAKFQNQFVEFELPPMWQCNLEGAEWVCQSTEREKKRDAIIVLAAKLAGDNDGITKYMDYLKRPKEWMTMKGKPIRSEPRYVKEASVANHPWVDSIHMESEIPGFLTRYLGTTKADIAVLVTYSVNKDKWAQYQGVFDSMVNTLKVFRRSGPINLPAGGESVLARAPIGQNPTLMGVFPDAGEGQQQAPAQKNEDDTFLYIILGAAVVLFILWRKRRSNG